MKCVTSLLLLHNMKALQKVIFIACFIKHRNKSQGIYYLPLNWVYLAATKKSYLQMLSSLLIHGSWPDCFCQPQNTGRYAHQTYSNVLARVVPFGGLIPAPHPTSPVCNNRARQGKKDELPLFTVTSLARNHLDLTACELPTLRYDDGRGR